MRLPVPTFACNQEIVLTKCYQDKTDRYGQPTSDEPVKISNCVVQLSPQYTGNNGNRQLTANGAVFLYAQVSAPFPSLTKNNLQSEIQFEGQTYHVTEIGVYKEPLSDDIFSYKLGVL